MSLAQFLPFFGYVAPAPPPVAAGITLAPAGPGDLGLAPAAWTARVTATGSLTQVKWLVGVPGAKTIQFPYNAPNNFAVPSYNHGDIINFTGYGAGFTLAKDSSGPNNFFAQGANGNDIVTIGLETQVSDIRYTIDGSGGTGPLAYTLVNLTSGAVDIQATFNRPGDMLIVKSPDETVSANSTPVSFGGAGVQSITLTPQAPGDLIASPATFTTRVNAVLATQKVQWIVLDANWVGSGTTEFTMVDLVNNTAMITCTLLKPGDRLVVKNIDYTVEKVSDQVIFSSGAKSLSLAPNAPGNLGSAPQVWTTVVTAINMAQFKWVVLNSDATAVGNWTIANVVSNSATIKPTFTAAGQKILVQSLDDKVSTQSSQVSFGGVIVGTTDYQKANNFVKDLTSGVNLERGTAVGEPESYFRNLLNNGVNFVRWYPPTRLDWNQITSESDINKFADVAQRAISAGQKVIFDCTDVVDHEQLLDRRIDDYIHMCARVFAARNFDPRTICIGAWNELAEWTEDNTPFNATREYYWRELRSILGPNFLLNTAGANWGNHYTMMNSTFSMIPDKLVIHKWHAYPWDATTLKSAQDQSADLQAWKADKGVVTINGEMAQAGETGGTDPANMPAMIDAQSRGSWKERLCYWTITGGSLFRMNNQYDNNLTSTFEQTFRSADAYIRAQPGFGT